MQGATRSSCCRYRIAHRTDARALRRLPLLCAPFIRHRRRSRTSPSRAKARFTLFNYTITCKICQYFSQDFLNGNVFQNFVLKRSCGISALPKSHPNNNRPSELKKRQNPPKKRRILPLLQNSKRNRLPKDVTSYSNSKAPV